MIWLEFEAKNVGAIEHKIVNLRGINIAAVSGKNGRGKSTMFTIVPMFALFGDTKNGVNVNQMVRVGAEEMLARVDLAINGVEYRIIRTYSKKWRGKSTCEFFRLEDGQTISLSGASIRETNAKIVEALCIDKEILGVSSILMQKNPVDLANQKPAKRKEIMARILGLGEYDALLEKAKAALRQKENALAVSREKIAEADSLDEEIARLGVEYIEADNAIVAAASAVKAEELAFNQNGKALLSLKERMLNEQNRKKLHDDAKSDYRAVSTNEIMLERKIEEVELIVGNADVIKQRAARRAELETKISTLREAEERQQRDRQELAEMKDELAKKQSGLSSLDNVIHALEAAMQNETEVRARVSRLEELTKTVIPAHEKRKELHESEQRRFDEQMKDANAQLAECGANVLSAENAVKSFSEKALLLADCNCIDIDRAECKFLKSAQEAKRRLPEAQEELERAQIAKKDREMVCADIELRHSDKLAEIGFDANAYRLALSEANTLKPAETELAKIERAKADAENTYKLKAVHSENIDALRSRIDEKASQIDKDGVIEFEALKEEFDALSNASEKLEQLNKNIAELSGLRVELDAFKDQAKKLATTIAENADAENKVFEVAAEIAALESVISEQERTLGTLRDREKTAEVSKSNIKVHLDIMRKTVDEAAELKKQIAPDELEIKRLSILCRAFSRDGIPSYITEAATPELEAMANSVLNRMTNGQHSLMFRAADENGESVLDIFVTDESGEYRAYETFSGGEQTRADLAIRIAIGQMRASKSAVRIESIILDEALAPLDEMHRNLVIDTLNGISEMYKQVLVITHIDAAKPKFDTIIEI